MSAYIRSLEKQNEMFREELRIHAQAVDELSERLAGALKQVAELQPPTADAVTDGSLIDGDLVEKSSTH
ncbi:hypothetical protein P6U16_08350 [Rhizobium sp. 32-5/1]|uniref:hypothetical protein n=1 Tax=Rhizobium sp. 32-5/1 TaxID=3019602 RepID=UPI00240D71B3|nr:hypothetical protein [Rhizobium sp. 32-5/1]WEZ84570.1 hypothetical protein P6U16_08350 [Rhizobium sp. 32-5/1]